MTSKYVDSLENSLKVKCDILDRLTALTNEQRDIASKDNVDWDEFDARVESKSSLIEELNKLDEGFEVVFSKVKTEINANKDAYKESIIRIQKLIKLVTEKSTGLMALETRTKALVEQSFAKEKKKLSGSKKNNKVAVGYYNNMNKINYIDPQLMDQKK